MAEDRYEIVRYELRRQGVAWLAYASAARHLIRLQAPALLVFLPLTLQ